MASAVQEYPAIPYEFGKKMFPSQVDGKLNTIEFLEASQGVVNLVSKLGSVFSPLYNDISSNIDKVKKCYEKDPIKYAFIEDLIICEKRANSETSIDALLWLRRALHFTLIFFQNMLHDERKTENLEEHMTSAYSQTLEPYHGWITKKLFKFFKNLMPKRSDLLLKISGKNREGNEPRDQEEIERVLKFLELYFRGLSDNVDHIECIFQRHNLDSSVKI